MFERLKTQKVCKRKANASRYTLNLDSGQTWSEKQVTQVNVVLGWGPGVGIFRVGVKLIDARVLNVSSQSVAFLREIFGQNEGAHSNFDPPPCGEG